MSNTSTANDETANDNGSNFFLASENLCGRTLLTLITKGHAICANVKILSERVPIAFVIAADLDDAGNGVGGVGGKAKKKATTEAKGSGGGLFSIFASSSSSGDTTNNNNKKKTRLNDTNQGDDDDEAPEVVAERYSRFLFDFSYLHNPEEAEASLATNANTTTNDRRLVSSTTTSSSPSSLQSESEAENDDNALLLHQLEREFTINHRDSITEFYNLFYSIYEYQEELRAFINDLMTGYYIQYTVESVLLDVHGRVLLCEAIWLLGVMLMLMERLLPVRTRDSSSRNGMEWKCSTTFVFKYYINASHHSSSPCTHTRAYIIHRVRYVND